METAILCLTASEDEPTPTSRLAYRAGPTTLRTDIPSDPSYDGGMKIYRCNCQGSEKKLSEESAFGKKNISYSLVNTLIKAVNNKKISNMTKRTANLMVTVTGYVPADFQAGKVRIVIPGRVSVKGRRPSLHLLRRNSGL
jgi:hypothetical protein